MFRHSKSNLWTRWYNGAGVHRSPTSARFVYSPPLMLTFLSYPESHQLTDQFEGTLIRVFRRLGELLRQMSQAAKVIGNAELKEKFDKSSEMLERPNSVIFCSSLYL